MRHVFFTNKTTNGAGAPMSVVDGGKFLFSVGGVPGGATVTVTVATHYTSGIAPTDNTFTTATSKTIDIPGRSIVSATISGATGTTNLSCDATK